MPRRRTSRLRLLGPGAVACALALGLAACGGSGKPKSTTGAAVAAPVTSGTTTSSSTSTHTSGKAKKAKAKKQAKQAKGHGSSSHTTSTHTTSTTASHRNPSSSSKPKPSGPTYVKPLHARLIAPNHHPIANKPWPYTVIATDANGTPLPGTVDVQFTFQGVVVGHDTPRTHKLSGGRWHDELTYPPRAIGEPIALQLVVHTSIGSATINWPVVVRK